MTHASVFSGIGGPEVAATMLGWENLFHCEINPFGRKVLDYWYPKSKSYEDITTTDFTEWRGRVDVLTGGFPCQPFSYAGRRRGAEDDRYLWPSMYRAIDEIQPTWVVAENVAGILTMVEQGEVSKVAGSATLFDAFDDLRGRYELRETFTLQRICTDLESHGYAVQPVLVPACAVGAPHRRDRVFIVARRKDSVEGETRHEERAESGRPIADTESNGDSRRPRQVCGEERRPSELNAEPCINGEVQSSADTASIRQREHDRDDRRERQSGTCGQHIPQSDTEGRLRTGIGQAGDIRNATDAGQSADTISERLERQDEPRGGEIGEWLYIWRDIARHHRPTDEAIAGCGRWQDFPSVSPVHRGNDGLPFDVDRLTLSFGKWRTEALKAYGNAIVPQVMYEIFRAIEIVEQREQR